MSPSGCSSCLLFFLIQLCVALHYPRSGNVLCNLKGGQCLPSNTSLCNLLDVECDEGSICCSVATQTNASLTSRIPANCHTGPTDTNGSSGYITVYSASHYDNNLDCWWIITVGAGNTIDITWSLFDLEGPFPLCPFDYVVIYDNGNILGQKYCGTTSYPLTSSSNEVSVYFHTDSSVTRPGFQLIYSSPATCSGTDYRVQPSGSIVVWFDSLYDRNLDCSWIITVNPGDYIRIRWIRFDVEGPSPSCPWDYVMIEGIKYCGSGLPVPNVITISSNQVTVYFHTDFIVQRQGFIIQYSSV